jgi:hypothetical protein
MPKRPAPPTLTLAEIAQKIAEHKLLADARQEAVGQALGQERARHRKQIEALETKISGLELRVDALTHEASKRIKAAERREGGDVVELPNFIGRRHEAA